MTEIVEIPVVQITSENNDHKRFEQIKLEEQATVLGSPQVWENSLPFHYFTCHPLDLHPIYAQSAKHYSK